MNGREKSGRLHIVALPVLIVGLFGMAQAYTAAEVEHPGRIAGRVLFDGTPPDLPGIEIRKDTEVCGTSVKERPDLRIAEDGGVEHAVVFLEEIESGKPLDSTGPVLDQAGCEFQPHVLLVPVGATVEFRNSDGILHNIRSRSEKNPPFNRAQPGFKKVLEETFRKPEFIRVSCDAHEWMQAILVVHEHPYYVVTDSEGRFRIDGVPAGDYTLHAWHERLGEITRRASVEAEETTEVSFTFSGP